MFRRGTDTASVYCRLLFILLVCKVSWAFLLSLTHALKAQRQFAIAPLAEFWHDAAMKFPEMQDAACAGFLQRIILACFGRSNRRSYISRGVDR